MRYRFGPVCAGAENTEPRPGLLGSIGVAAWDLWRRVGTSSDVETEG